MALLQRRPLSRVAAVHTALRPTSHSGKWCIDITHLYLLFVDVRDVEKSMKGHQKLHRAERCLSAATAAWTAAQHTSDVRGAGDPKSTRFFQSPFRPLQVD